jgi:hypothetical protein
MFVVLLACDFFAWLSNELYFVQQRDRWRTEHRDMIPLYANELQPSIPFWRWMLGDKAVARIAMPGYPEPTYSEAQRLFPEAKLDHHSPR